MYVMEWSFRSYKLQYSVTKTNFLIVDDASVRLYV